MAARLVTGPSVPEPREHRRAPQQPAGSSRDPGMDGEPVFFVFGGAAAEQQSKDACCGGDGGGGASHPESEIQVPDAGRCAEHGAVLDWFCVTEQRLVCAQCAGTGPCSGHVVTPLAARVTAVRNQLVDVCEKMQLQALRIERFIEQTLMSKERKLQTTASRVREQVLAQVSVAREALEEEEQRLLEEVQREEERVEQCLLTQRAHWSQALRNLSQTRNCLVHTLTHTPDAQLVKCTQEIAERIEEAEGVGAPYDTHQLSLKADCSESKLLRGMWATAILQGPHAYGSTSLKFDERTVSPLLQLSENHCTLTFLHKKPYAALPENPARFDCWPNALGSLSTSSGTHSWVVDVGQSAAFKVGVCYASLQRKGSGNEARLGYNSESWVLSHYDNDYSFCHAGKKQPLQVVSRPQRIGLLLDWPSQTVLFYEPESSAILYCFKHNFSAPLLPACAVTDRSITILH